MSKGILAAALMMAAGNEMMMHNIRMRHSTDAQRGIGSLSRHKAKMQCKKHCRKKQK